MIKKIIISVFLIILSVGCTCSANYEKSVAIMYHDITSNPLAYSQYAIGTAALESDIKAFLSNGYRFVKASELVENQGNDKLVALTFDDGYESFYTEIFPLLKKYNVSASYYVLTSEIDRFNHLSKAQIKELAASELVEIGAHSHCVHKLGREGIQKLYNGESSKWDAYEDYKKSIEILESIMNKKVTSIAYPNGIYTDDIDWILRNELGMKITIGTDFGKITSFDSPIKRVNRDLNYTSEKFIELINSL